MGKLLAIVIIIPLFVLSCLAMFGIVQDKQVAVNMSTAHLEYTRAQSEAMLTRVNSQAFAMTMTSLVPWGVLFAVSMLGFGVLALCFTVVSMGYNRQPPLQIVYIPSPELPRREVWKVIAKGNNSDSLTANKRRDMIVVSSR